MINITKDTIIGDILDVAPQTAPIFLSIGMHCLGCPSSRGETVEEACMVHGIDVDKLLALGNEESQQGSVIVPLDRTHTGYRMRPEPCPERTDKTTGKGRDHAGAGIAAPAAADRRVGA